MKFHEWFAATLLVLVGSVAFLSLFSYTGTLVYSTWWEKDRLDRETQLASVDVSEMSEEEAAAALEGEIKAWQEEASVTLTWYDETITLPNDMFTFDVDTTVEQVFAGEGYENGIIVRADESELKKQLSLFIFAEDPAHKTNTEALALDLEAEVAFLPAEDTVKHVHDYLYEEVKPMEGLIQTANRSVTHSEQLMVWISAMENVTIPAEGTFSLLGTMEERGLDPVESEDLVVLASAVYEALLWSNFEVLERSQRHELLDGVPLGFDANVVPFERNLVFFNPNSSNYDLHLRMENNQLTAELHGLPLPYDIRVEVEQTAEIEPKTRVRFSSQRTEGDRAVIDNGAPGYQARTVRTIARWDEEEPERETVSEDYYTAQNRLEEWSIEERITEEEEDEDFIFDPTDPDGDNGDNGDPWGNNGQDDDPFGNGDDNDPWGSDDNGDPWGNGEQDQDNNNQWNGNGQNGSDPADPGNNSQWPPSENNNQTPGGSGTNPFDPGNGSGNGSGSGTGTQPGQGGSGTGNGLTPSQPGQDTDSSRPPGQESGEYEEEDIDIKGY
ncbi:VanW family protein [Bacillus sp. H-16]|uniref:G5 domain-containing protein n=1 Tax=Alteribacter salitolerans TaxID=2912333 RepID=UPI001963BBF4|nr:G5 domain-containing protein [Alteribacter salitolerans]MBM7096576.1 VanW family protein [Alteribacter salitolerans]